MSSSSVQCPPEKKIKDLEWIKLTYWWQGPPQGSNFAWASLVAELNIEHSKA
jgi:hypothetical protein